MTTQQLQDRLRDLIETVLFARNDPKDPARVLAEHLEGIRQIATYHDIGTRGKGIVFEADDGTELHVVIADAAGREEVTTMKLSAIHHVQREARHMRTAVLP